MEKDCAPENGAAHVGGAAFHAHRSGTEARVLISAIVKEVVRMCCLRMSRLSDGAGSTGKFRLIPALENVPIQCQQGRILIVDRTMG